MRADTLEAALSVAIRAGDAVHGTTSPNPPVGAVILNPAGDIVGVGATRPHGGDHAEVVALNMAGEDARGGTAVVTLEPCNHTGLTGPCTQALLTAGITEVRYVHSDPNPQAQGGEEFLREQGVQVGRLQARVAALEAWLTSVRKERPAVTLKMAQTLDGFTAAVDGSSQWITSKAARMDVHRDRLKRDAIIVGTGTAIADNPSLTARPAGRVVSEDSQPRRVVIGTRDISASAGNLVRLGYEQYPTIEHALTTLWRTGARDVLVEGGAHLAGSFLEEGLVDALRIYIAPTLLGGGTPVLAGTPAPTLDKAEQFRRVGLEELGPDILVELTR